MTQEERAKMSGFPNQGAPVPRRAILHGAAAVFAALVTLIASGGRALAKMTQKAALYRDKPKEGAKCSNCLHFQPPASCQIVDGTISPNGWCQMYVKK